MTLKKHHTRKSLIVAVGLIFSFYNTLYAQQKFESNQYINRSLVTASPVASGFGVFGDVPVSHFTGTPDINIPLYQVAYKELYIDLSLRYHQAIGTKPDAFPGITGNGWMLNTGGVIIRVSRGTIPYNFPNNVPVPVNFNPTKDPNWSSAATMQTHLKNQTVFVNAEGRYDEYQYNFGGRTGKFYIDHTDVFRIKSEQGEDILVQKDPALSYKEFTMPAEPQLPLSCLATGVAYTDIIKQRNFVYKFTLTDSQGVKYTFGGTDQSIEFTRPGMVYNGFDLKDENTLPTSWYLTSIESPNGYKIDLNYKRDKFYITSEAYVSDKIILPGKFADNDNSPKGRIIKSTLYHPCYLDEIITPISKVKFDWSIANQQLGYTFNVVNPPLPNCGAVPGDLHSQFHFTKYPEIRDAPITGRFPNKLDNFVVSNSVGVRKMKVEFTYTNLATTRLKLLSVRLKGESDTPQNIPTYSFEYNPLALPEYLSYKNDDYGFYNNKNPYITSSDPIYYYNMFTNAATRQLYLDSRKPDIDFTKAEVLQKVTYPTGGYTEYEFENHEYGRTAKYWPASVQENANGAVYTGGLRIKRISHYDYLNHKATEKKYFYKLNYAAAGATSSGVLNYEPMHFAYFNGAVQAPAKYAGTPGAPNFEGNMTYTQYSTDPLNASGYRSNHINYSEVAEVDLDGSYSVYKYKNYDNGYHDKPAENMVSDNVNVGEFWKEDEMNSMELERGQILSEQSYNSANSLKQDAVYAYNDDINRFNSHVRRIKMVPNPIFTMNYPSLRYTASLVYTYYPFLKTKTTTHYETGGNVVNAATATYHATNRLIASETSVDSKGQTVVISYKYPHDYAADPVSIAMSSKHMIAPVFETKTTVAGTQESLVQTPYYSPSANIYVPQEVKVQNGPGALETRLQFTKYDSRGTLLEQQKPGDVKENFLWSRSHYLMAKVVGSDHNTISAAIDQSALGNGEINELMIPSFLDAMRNDIALTHKMAQITTYTYTGTWLFGPNAVTDPNRKSLHYLYDSFGRLKSVNNGNGMAWSTLRASYCYNYAGQPVDCSTMASIGSIAAPPLTLLGEGALPVTLISFEAVKQENIVKLNWSTSFETNSDRFEIERSIDGKQWLKLGIVSSQGESNAEHEYSFTDNGPIKGGPSKGENLYRLKMVDVDSTFTYSRIRSGVFGQEGDVALYPNPVTIGDELTLLTDDMSRIASVKIYDSLGKLTHQAPASKQINTRKLQAGLYMVLITYMDGSISSHRVVKQ
ncbi:T9SS type A sorting domain-containing protein [Dyadobacter pollutisoli]|uniref:T9SS type A sorting domain-containing protein n=1 Tax=Dyadobacter pollutisoli TaxID=2910158 RepID=A0A9E8NDF7_9BACT|nr:T9SS type A sorting domain-containing protein [Dyadobacter pollutisoli]WAC14695.1 T9SS type A sorting domain-containing protein [Dyadobacter pollutisoli]